MYKKIIIFAVVAFFATFQQASANQGTKAFNDIPNDYVYIHEINAMIEQGIISGYPDNTFKPNQLITRSHAAKLINKAVTLNKIKEFTKPKDLPEGHAYYKDLKKMIEAGLLEADTKGNINPNQPLKRGEMAKILSVAFDLISHTYKMPLRDVSNGMKEHVHSLYDYRITTGFDDNTFRENEGVTRAHYTVFMHRAMKYVNLPELALLTDTEIEKLGNRYLIKYIEPFRYRKSEYYPEGVTDIKSYSEEQKLKFNRTAVLVRNSGYSGTSVNRDFVRFYSEGEILELIKRWSENIFGTTLSETIEIINKVYEDGLVISSLDITTEKRAFAMFYNYAEGMIEMYIDRPYEENLSAWYIQAYLTTSDYQSLDEIKVPNKKLGAELLTKQLQQQYLDLKNKEHFTEEQMYNMINNRSNLESIVKEVARKIQKSPEEIITLFNIAYQTGGVVSNKEVDPVSYALYFDFVSGKIIVGAK